MLWGAMLYIPMPWRMGLAGATLVFLAYKLLPLLMRALARMAALSMALLLFVQYQLTAMRRNAGKRPLPGAYVLGDLLAAIEVWALGIAKARLKFPRRPKVWIACGLALPILLWFVRPSMDGTGLARLVDDNLGQWYCFEGWMMTSEWAPLPTRERPDNLVTIVSTALSPLLHPGSTAPGSTVAQPNERGVATRQTPTVAATKPKPTKPAAPTKTPTSPPQVQLGEVCCPRTETCITWPRTGSRVAGQVVVEGTATRPQFAYYKFELKSPPQKEWSHVARFEQPVADGMLLTWDTTTLQDGTYRLRLVVVDQTGNYWPDFPMIEVTVDN